MRPPARPVIPRLATSRLLLRPVRATDHLDVARGLRHPDVYRYLSIRLLTDTDALKQMDWYAGWHATGQGAWWAITQPASSTLMGVAGLYDHNPQHRRAEMAYWLLPDYWHQGYAREAGAAIVRYAFEQRGIYRLQVRTEPDNGASCQVAQALGFQLEGVQRAAEWANGQPLDIATYALLLPGFQQGYLAYSSS